MAGWNLKKLVAAWKKWAATSHTWIVSQKDFASTVQAMIATLAFLTAGYWTYTNFIAQRQNHPRLMIVHKVSHLVLPNGVKLLSVDELYSNPGPVLLEIREGDIRVVKLLPLPPGPRTWAAAAASKDLDADGLRKLNDQYKSSLDDLANWPLLAWRNRKWAKGEFVIEPGESDQVHCEFIIPPDVEAVNVMTYISNPSSHKKDIGWRENTIYDFRTTSREQPNTTNPASR
jgi:hypothetical protein